MAPSSTRTWAEALLPTGEPETYRDLAARAFPCSCSAGTVRPSRRLWGSRAVSAAGSPGTSGPRAGTLLETPREPETPPSGESRARNQKGRRPGDRAALSPQSAQGLRERGDRVCVGGVSPRRTVVQGTVGRPLLWGQEGQLPPVPPELGDVAPRWEAGQVGLAGGAAGRPRHWELKVPFLQRTQLTLPFSFRCL